MKKVNSQDNLEKGTKLEDLDFSASGLETTKNVGARIAKYINGTE